MIKDVWRYIHGPLRMVAQRRDDEYVLLVFNDELVDSDEPHVFKLNRDFGQWALLIAHLQYFGRMTEEEARRVFIDASTWAEVDARETAEGGEGVVL